MADRFCRLGTATVTAADLPSAQKDADCHSRAAVGDCAFFPPLDRSLRPSDGLTARLAVQVDEDIAAMARIQLAPSAAHRSSRS